MSNGEGVTPWKQVAIDLVLDLMREYKLSAGALAENLKDVGFEISAQAIRNKLGRGAFSAEFLLAAIGSVGNDQAEKRKGKSRDVRVTLSGASLLEAYRAAKSGLEQHELQMEHFRRHGIPPNFPPEFRREFERQLKRYEKLKLSEKKTRSGGRRHPKRQD